jgi:hypothetical protein
VNGVGFILREDVRRIAHHKGSDIFKVDHKGKKYILSGHLDRDGEKFDKLRTNALGNKPYIKHNDMFRCASRYQFINDTYLRCIRVEDKKNPITMSQYESMQVYIHQLRDPNRGMPSAPELE